MKNKLTLALVAVLTSTAFAALQTPLPEFKTDKQLAEWRAEKAVASTNRSHVPEESAFYTGKPYIESSGGYAFKYRSYNPELARWTSEDPSGFPDGSNAYSYINNTPVTAYDLEGLFKQVVKRQYEVTISNYYVKSYAEVAGYAAGGGVSAGIGIAAIVSNPVGWVVGAVVAGGMTVGGTYVYGVGLSEAGNKARNEYPMWSDKAGGGSMVGSAETMTVNDDFAVRNYVTGYDADGHFGATDFEYSMTISYDRYTLVE
jgi:RHS repeat-associated protein